MLSVPSRPVALPLRASPASASPLLYRVVPRCLPAPCSARWFDLTVEGLEQLPAGPFILAANHHNYLDGVVLGVAVPRPISFLVMPRVYHASPLHPAFHRRIGSIPVNLSRPGSGRDQARAARAGRGPHRRHLPRGPLQPRGPARPRAARRRRARAPRRRARGARGDRRHLRGAARPALLRAAAASAAVRFGAPLAPARGPVDQGPVAPSAWRSRAGSWPRSPAPRASPRVTEPGGTALGRPLRASAWTRARRPSPRRSASTGGSGPGTSRGAARGRARCAAPASSPRPSWTRSSRARRGAGRARERALSVPAGAGGHPPQHRAPAHRAGGAGGRQAPHRPLAQRPDRARRAALPARDHRPRRRRGPRRPGGAGRPRRGAPGRAHAGLHPPAARPARAARRIISSPTSSCSSATAQRLADCARAGQRAAAGRGRARRRRLPHRPRGPRPRSRLRRAPAPTAWTR